MASLTGTIDQPTRGKSIVGGEKASPGLFDAIAEPLTSVISNLGVKDSRAKANARYQREVGKDAALNTAEQLRFDELNRVNNELKKTRDGVNQGRIPPGALDLKVEAKVQELYNKFPEYKADIASYYKERGFDHWMFREAEAAKSEQDAQIAAGVKAGTDDYAYAFEHGFGHPDKSFEENRLAGQNARAADEIIKKTREAAEAKMRLSAEERAQKAFEQPQSDRDAFGALNVKLQTRLDQFTGPVDAFIASATGDPEKEKRLAEVVPQLGNWIESERAKAKTEAGAALTPELERMIDNRFDIAKKGLEDRFSGTLSSYNQTKQTLASIETNFKLKAGESLRAYSDLVAIFGKESVNGMFPAGVLPFNEKTKKEVTDELRGYSTAEAGRGRVHLMNAARILKGELNIKDLTEAEAIEQLPTIAAATAGTQAAILKGDVSNETVKSWQNGYGTILDAASEIQPGASNLSSLWAGTRIFASPGARTTLMALMAQPEHAEGAKALVLGSRGAAAQTLEVARQTSSNDLRQYQSIRFDGTKYVVDFDRRAFEKDASKRAAPVSGKGYFPSPSAYDARQIDKTTRDKISIMNASLDHLVELAQYDDSVPKGVTPKQLRDHYANGTPFVKVGGKPMLTSDQEFIQAVDAFESKVKTDAASPGPRGIPITDIRFASPTDALVRTILGEDPKNVKAVASVILNRANGDLKRVPEVVLAKGQFEPWGDDKTRQRLLSIDPDSKEYQRVLAQLLPLLSGDQPRDSFTHFYAPETQKALGRKPPEWDNGTGVDLGATRFFTLSAR